MNNLIIHPEYSNLIDRLEELKIIITEKIAKKDYLIFHECKNIETAYMLKIGHLDFKIFETKLNIRKIKREIAIIQKHINLQKEIDLNFIKNQIEIEFEEYILKLEEKAAKINMAINRAMNKTLSKEESLEIKKIYKELILKLHPDLNEELSKNEEDLFFKVMESYEAGDLERLKVLKVLASDISNNEDEPVEGNILDKLKENINLLEIRLELIDKEIDEVKDSYPYNKKFLLDDEEKLEENKEILQNELNIFIETLAMYKKKLDYLLNSINN